MAHPRIAIAPDDDPRWALAKDGDSTARNSLVEEHIRLLDQVTAVVCSNLPTYVAREDVWSFGSFGLIRAVETYNPEIASFRTHAVFLIKARIYDELRSLDWLPKSARKKVRDVESVRETLRAESGDHVPPEEIAEVLGVDTSYVHDATVAKRTSAVGSLDEDRATGPVNSLYSAQDTYSVAEYLHTFSAWLESLDEDQQAVWALRFYARLTTKQAAEHLGVSAGTVATISSSIFQSFHSYVDKTLVSE